MLTEDETMSEFLISLKYCCKTASILHEAIWHPHHTVSTLPPIRSPCLALALEELNTAGFFKGFIK